jgi:hypothetical protein
MSVADSLNFLCNMEWFSIVLDLTRFIPVPNLTLGTMSLQKNVDGVR